MALSLLTGYSQDNKGCILQGSLYSDSSEVVIGLPFVLWIRDNGVNGCQLHVQYATQTGNPFPVKPAVIMRLLDTYADIVDQAGTAMVPFTQNSIDFTVNRDWVEAVYEGPSSKAIIVIRDGRTRFLTDESYTTIRDRFIICPPTDSRDTFNLVAENGLHLLNDSTVHLGGNLIENTDIVTDGYNFLIKEPTTTARFGLGYTGGIFGDTVFYFYRPWGSSGLNDNRFYLGRNINGIIINRENGSSLRSFWENRTNSGSPQFSVFADKGNNQATFLVSSQGGGISMFDPVTERYSAYSVSKEAVSMYIGQNSDNKNVQIGVLRNSLGRKFPFIVDQKVADSSAVAGETLTLIDPLIGEVKYIHQVLDTFVIDTNFAITDSLLSECRELYLSASASILAGDFVTIGFPVPTVNYRGKKIDVYVEDNSATYAVVLDCAAAGLYFTDDTSSVLPTAQTTIITDASPWKSKGVTYSFTCSRNNDGNYYWKLKQ